MILDLFDELNWLAVLVGTIAWFAFSGVWFSLPPISAAWQRAARVTVGEGPPLVLLLIPTFVAYFVTAVVIGLVAEGIDADGFGDGLALGATLGIGFGAAEVFVNHLYERKGNAYWLINGTQAVVGYSIVAVIVALWD